nr:hypothetical protein [Tanacetum cinerariifolium]
MDAFRLLMTQFQTFIKEQYYFVGFDDLMISKYFLAYTRTEVQQFRNTLIQHIKSVKKSIDERAQHKRQYDRRVNKRIMQTQESNVVLSKASDVDLGVMESSGIESGKQDTSSSLRNYLTHVVDAGMEDKQLLLIAKNNEFKAQLQEKGFTIAALKNELRNLTENHMNTKFAKPSILGKLVLQPLRNQSVVRQPTAFRSGRPKFLKPRFAFQVDVNNVLLKPVTLYYLPKVRESVFVKPNHVIASDSSRSSSKKSYGSNDMAHNYYLEFSPNKTSVVHEKPNTLRSCLRWKPTGRIFKTAGLRWIPTGKMFTDYTTKVDSKPPNGSNDDITNPYECDKTLNVSAGTLNLSAGLVQNSVYPTPYVPPSKKDYEILFQPLCDEYFNPPPLVVSLDPTAVAAPRAVDLAGSSLTTTIDQDVPSSNPSSEETTLLGFIPSNLHHLNQSFHTLTKLTKNHPLENVIGDPSRPVSKRSQLQGHAIWCCFDTNGNPITLVGNGVVEIYYLKGRIMVGFSQCFHICAPPPLFYLIALNEEALKQMKKCHVQLILAVGISAFAAWGLGPLLRASRILFLQQLTRQLEDQENVTDPVARLRMQSSALRSRALLQNLGSLLASTVNPREASGREQSTTTDPAATSDDGVSNRKAGVRNLSQPRGDPDVPVVPIRISTLPPGLASSKPICSSVSVVYPVLARAQHADSSNVSGSHARSAENRPPEAPKIHEIPSGLDQLLRNLFPATVSDQDTLLSNLLHQIMYVVSQHISGGADGSSSVEENQDRGASSSRPDGPSSPPSPKRRNALFNSCKIFYLILHTDEPVTSCL